MSQTLLIVLAVILALFALLLLVNAPALARYLRIRSWSRAEPPKGVTHTPRAYVTGGGRA